LHRKLFLSNAPAALVPAFFTTYRITALACCLAFTALVGCGSNTIRVGQPTINASRAGSQAIEMYDKNGDGLVSGDELEKAPALKAALANLDTNGDKAVSADEVTARVNAWKAMKTGMTGVRCHVTLDNEPLGGATVTFEPEAFLGDEIKPAVGLTNPYGDAAPSIPPKDRPAPNVPGGAHFGLYKVRISKIENGKETIPARYNTDTILGQEVSYDDPAMRKMNVTFALKSGN
jgi:hypothetical protein